MKQLQFLAVYQAEGLRLEAKRRADNRRVLLLERAQRIALWVATALCLAYVLLTFACALAYRAAEGIQQYLDDPGALA